MQSLETQNVHPFALLPENWGKPLFNAFFDSEHLRSFLTHVNGAGAAAMAGTWPARAALNPLSTRMYCLHSLLLLPFLLNWCACEGLPIPGNRGQLGVAS